MTREYPNKPANQAQAPIDHGLGERDLPRRINKPATNEPATQPTQTGEATNAINRHNPAAILLRAGILLGMKLNMCNIGSQLRYAYLSDEQAKSRNLDMERLAHLRKVLAKLENVLFLGGGRPENLKRAILGGKGNHDKAVPLGFDGDSTAVQILGSAIYESEMASAIIGQNGHGSLGEVTTAAAIAAASDMLVAVAAIVKQVGEVTRAGATSEAAAKGEAISVPEYQAPVTDANGNDHERIAEDSPAPHLESAQEAIAPIEKAAPAMEPINSDASCQRTIEQPEPEEQPNVGIVVEENDAPELGESSAAAPTLDSTSSNAVQKPSKQQDAKSGRHGTASSYNGKPPQKRSPRNIPWTKACRPQIRPRSQPCQLRGARPHPHELRGWDDRMDVSIGNGDDALPWHRLTSKAGAFFKTAPAIWVAIRDRQRGPFTRYEHGATARKPKFCTFPSAWGMGLGVCCSEYLTLKRFSVMKRIGFVLSFLVLVAAPAVATARPHHNYIEASERSELSWTTVNAVLKKVSGQGRYPYSSLVGWYDSGQLAVTQNGTGGYELRICNADGLLDVIHIDSL